MTEEAAPIKFPLSCERNVDSPAGDVRFATEAKMVSVPAFRLLIFSDERSMDSGLVTTLFTSTFVTKLPIPWETISGLLLPVATTGGFPASRSSTPRTSAACARFSRYLRRNRVVSRARPAFLSGRERLVPRERHGREKGSGSELFRDFGAEIKSPAMPCGNMFNLIQVALQCLICAAVALKRDHGAKERVVG